jgi:hypothetical protein
MNDAAKSRYLGILESAIKVGDRRLRRSQRLATILIVWLGCCAGLCVGLIAKFWGLGGGTSVALVIATAVLTSLVFRVVAVATGHFPDDESVEIDFELLDALVDVGGTKAERILMRLMLKTNRLSLRELREARDGVLAQECAASDGAHPGRTAELLD